MTDFIPNRPNIVFIMADDMGYGDAGCYGAKKIRTPNIDDLASSGMLFTDAHSSSAVCTPSRYSVLTGRYAWRSRLKDNVQCGHGLPLIEEGRTTVASMLKSLGYATGAFGKWHLGFTYTKKDGSLFTKEQSVNDSIDNADFHIDEIDYTKPLYGGPLDHGFDRFFGISGSLDMPPYCFIKDRNTVGIPTIKKEIITQQRAGLRVETWDDTEVDLRFTEEACKFISSSVEYNVPFFAYIPLSSPHRPCVPPAFIRGKSDAGLRGDSVMLADWCLGKIVDNLKSLDVLENTLIVFTSDNGANPCDYYGRTYGHKPNGDLRGFKADIYEGGHRVPMVVSWPGNIPAGTVSDSLGGLIDFMATVAKITGYELKSDESPDGFSLLNVFLNPHATSRELIINHSFHGMFAIRSKDWKLIDGLGSGGFSAPSFYKSEREGLDGQLYSMKDDFWEQVNSFLRESEIVGKMLDDLEDIKNSEV